MQRIVYGMAGMWAALVVTSFVAFEAAAPTGDDLTRGLARLSSFMTWQAIALGLAIATALVAHRAVARGVAKVKLAGYAPLALSLFLVASLVAIIAFQVLVKPLFV